MRAAAGDKPGLFLPLGAQPKGIVMWRHCRDEGQRSVAGIVIRSREWSRVSGVSREH